MRSNPSSNGQYTKWMLGKVVILKRILLRSTIVLVCLLSLSAISLYALLQSRYAADVVNLAAKALSPYSLTTRQALYTPPYQLELQDVEFTTDQHTQLIPKVTLWLNPYLFSDGKLALDSLLIEGANIDLEALDTQFLHSLHLHHLALKHVDVSTDSWSVRELGLQVKSPKWTKPNQPLPYGDIQLSAQQLYTQGEAFDQLLFDADYQPQDSTVYGLSFDWRGANISGQAEQYQEGWSLVNVTINQLKLPSTIPSERLLETLQSLSLSVTHINSLDILESSFEYAGWHFDKLDASLENIALTRSVWQQQQGYLSFDADSATREQLQFTSPTAKLGFTPQGVSVDEFDADFKQGRLQLSGLVSPSTIHLKSLKLSGIKWLENTSDLIHFLQDSALNELSINELKVSNSQLIQVEQKPYWQLSGLNIEGEQLSLIQKSQWSLFSGEVEISANSASWDKWLTTQAILNIHSDNGNIALTRAFLPLANGYVEATGQWDRSQLSAPWQFRLHGDGIPLNQPWVQEKLPFTLTGVAELEMAFSGLSGDYSMLAHSMSGKAVGQIHGGTIDARSIDGELRFQHAWPFEPIQVHSDRGRLTIQAQSDNAQLSGRLDLTKPEFGSLLLNINQDCQQLWSEIFEQTNVIKERCSVPQRPTSAQPESNQEADGNASPITD